MSKNLVGTEKDFPSTLDQNPDKREGFETTELYAPFLREPPEPYDGFEPVPLWVSLAFGALLCYGTFYMVIQTKIGGWEANTFDRSFTWTGGSGGPGKKEAAPEPPMVLGARIFNNNCAQCHKSQGEGNPPSIPPLAGSEWVAGDQASVARLSRILLYGLNGPITVKGVSYNGAMPAWASLGEEKIAAVLTYIRASWGNQAEPITKEQVAAAKKAAGTRGPLNGQAELLSIPIDYVDPGATPATAAPATAAAPTPADKKDAMPAKK